MARQRILSFLSLFASASTLVCCALPALFVALGMGAAFAGLVSQAPQLIWMSENKRWFFAGGAAMLLVAGIAQHQARHLPCPLDAEQAEACSRARRWSRITYAVSLAVYVVGGLFAYGV